MSSAFKSSSRTSAPPSKRDGRDLGPPLVANETDPVPVPDSLRKRLVEDNSLDIEFYEHARDLLLRAERV